MRQILIHFSIIVVFLILGYEKSFAKIYKIAIVNLIDTTLLHNHLGVTIFTNNIETFTCQLNCKEYIDKELSKYLRPKYEPSFIKMPDSLKAKFGSINNDWGSIKKAFKPWILSLRDKYDLVIYIENVPMSYGGLENLVLQSNGLFTEGLPYGANVVAYSTICFTAIIPSSIETIDYEQGFMKYLSRIKKTEFIGSRKEINPEMLPLIKTKLEELMDSKIEYFLTNSGLITKGDFAIMKSKKTE